MQKTKQTTSTRLLVITITTAAIIAAVTTTTMSAATPAFAKINCDDVTNPTVCSGGGGCARNIDLGACTGSQRPNDSPGGGGGHFAVDPLTNSLTDSGGSGRNTDSLVGGGGFHVRCEPSPDCTLVGSGNNGVHVK
jgi:hypothetical protein